MEDKLKGRKHDIMISIVEDYIKDATPITSGAVQKNHLQDISTATLRNELNALEAMGLLRQLHTSGGRVPTAVGYRYYVSNLLKDLPLDYKQVEAAKDILEERTKSLSEIVSSLSKVINKAVKYPTVIFVNGYDKLTVEAIKIVPLVGHSALALIQTAGGYLTNTLDVSASEKACSDASNFLTKKFSGKTIGEMMETMEEMESEMQNEIVTFKEVLDNLIDGLKNIIAEKLLDIRHDGSLDLLAESGETGEQAKKVLKLLSDEDDLERAMEIDSDDLTVTFVDEDDYSGLALVKAPLCIDGTPIASIGVFGPQRMDYQGIASALKVIMNELKGDTDER